LANVTGAPQAARMAAAQVAQLLARKSALLAQSTIADWSLCSDLRKCW